MTTYNVTNSNDSGAGSLRNAINQANANPGKDEIIIDVDNVNITSEIQISESLDIQGNGVVITQTGNEPLLYIDELDDDIFQDVTLTNLTLTGGNSPAMGGAIQAWENITLDKVTIKDNKGSGFGGGLYASGGSVIIKDSLFEGNEVLTDEFGDHTGGALVVEFGTTVGIDNSIFRGNVSPKQAVALKSVTAIITNTEIVDNLSHGIITSSTVLDANNILVDGNKGTGVVALGGSSWIIESSTVSNNDGSELAGGVVTAGSTIVFENSLIDSNMSTGDGGGVLITPTSTFNVFDSVISNNTAATGAGIKGVDNTGSAIISNTYFTNNVGGEQIEGFNLDFRGSNVDNPLGVAPTTTVGYVAPGTSEPETDLPVAEVHRFFQNQKGFHFYTANYAESINIQALSNLGELNYDYEGESFGALSSNKDITGTAIAGAKEVYRLYNQETGSHLFTMDVGEKDFILDNLDNYSSEGVAYYAFEAEQAGIETIPLYRMLNTETGTHLFTSNAGEFDFVSNNLDHFTAEADGGVAFYVMEL